MRKVGNAGKSELLFISFRGLRLVKFAEPCFKYSVGLKALMEAATYVPHANMVSM